MTPRSPMHKTGVILCDHVVVRCCLFFMNIKLFLPLSIMQGLHVLVLLLLLLFSPSEVYCCCSCLFPSCRDMYWCSYCCLFSPSEVYCCCSCLFPSCRDMYWCSCCSSWAQEGCTVPCPPGRHTDAPVCHPL